MRRRPHQPQPGYDNRFDKGFREVQDPYEPDKTLVVAYNGRGDMVDYFTKNHNLPEHLRRAGNRFLAIVQMSEAATGLAVDPTREPVDGGGDMSGVMDARLRAALELDRIQEHIGIRDFRIARRMICLDPAAYREPKDRYEREYLNRRFRDILTDLALLFGFMGKTEKAA